MTRSPLASTQVPPYVDPSSVIDRMNNRPRASQPPDHRSSPLQIFQNISRREIDVTPPAWRLGYGTFPYGGPYLPQMPGVVDDFGSTSSSARLNTGSFGMREWPHGSGGILRSQAAGPRSSLGLPREAYFGNNPDWYR